MKTAKYQPPLLWENMDIYCIAQNDLQLTEKE